MLAVMDLGAGLEQPLFGPQHLARDRRIHLRDIVGKGDRGGAGLLRPQTRELGFKPDPLGLQLLQLGTLARILQPQERLGPNGWVRC